MEKQRRRQPRVIVFSTPTCSFCNAAKRYFKQGKIKFKDVDVSRDPAAARDMQRRTGQMGVPVIDIGGKILFPKYVGNEIQLNGTQYIIMDEADVPDRLKE